MIKREFLVVFVWMILLLVSCKPKEMTLLPYDGISEPHIALENDGAAGKIVIRRTGPDIRCATVPISVINSKNGRGVSFVLSEGKQELTRNWEDLEFTPGDSLQLHKPGRDHRCDTSFTVDTSIVAVEGSFLDTLKRNRPQVRIDFVGDNRVLLTASHALERDWLARVRVKMHDRWYTSGIGKPRILTIRFPAGVRRMALSQHGKQHYTPRFEDTLTILPSVHADPYIGGEVVVIPQPNVVSLSFDTTAKRLVVTRSGVRKDKPLTVKISARRGEGYANYHVTELQIRPHKDTASLFMEKAKIYPGMKVRPTLGGTTLPYEYHYSFDTTELVVPSFEKIRAAVVSLTRENDRYRIDLDHSLSVGFQVTYRVVTDGKRPVYSNFSGSPCVIEDAPGEKSFFYAQWVHPGKQSFELVEEHQGALRIELVPWSCGFRPVMKPSPEYRYSVDPDNNSASR